MIRVEATEGRLVRILRGHTIQFNLVVWIIVQDASVETVIDKLFEDNEAANEFVMAKVIACLVKIEDLLERRGSHVLDGTIAVFTLILPELPEVLVVS